MASIFYAWQLARMFLVYAAVASACADERFAPALLKGMAIGLCVEAALTLWERFVRGEIQAAGSAGHQNLLGMVSHFAVFPLLALLLAGQRSRLTLIGLFAGMVVVVLGASRATLGLAGAGYVGLFALSALRKWTPQKAKILGAGLAIAVLMVPLAIFSLERRFAAQPLTDEYNERAAFQAVANMMLSDHPLGVGANYYVIAANTQGYNERAGVTWSSFSAVVHNTYWLTLAETGYFGLIALVIFLLRPMMTAFLCGWRSRDDWRGELLLGLGVSLLTVYMHSFFEWVFVTFQAQYMLALNVGVIAGLSRELGYWGRAPSRSIVPQGDRAIAKITQRRT